MDTIPWDAVYARLADLLTDLVYVSMDLAWAAAAVAPMGKTL